MEVVSAYSALAICATEAIPPSYQRLTGKRSATDEPDQDYQDPDVDAKGGKHLEGSCLPQGLHGIGVILSGLRQQSSSYELRCRA